MRRNIKISNPVVKERAYKTLVRPVLEYAHTVWDPHTVENTRQIEMVQRRAARYTLGRYRRTSSVGSMLAELGWKTLADRRHQARLTMFYKIHHQLVAVPMPLQLKHYYQPTRTENTLAYHIPSSIRDYHLKSFFPWTARSWNILPESAVQSPSVDAFKRAIDN